MHRNHLLLILVLLSGYSLSLIASSVEESTPEFSSEDISRGQGVYKKSNCAFCHGWAGDGKGHPRSPSAAANLRTSVLDKESMTYIIRCGVVGGVMPYHDRKAYRDMSCGIDPASISSDLLPQKGKNISAKDMDALLLYIMSSVQKQGEVTFEQCETYFKPSSRNCLYLKSSEN